MHQLLSLLYISLYNEKGPNNYEVYYNANLILYISWFFIQKSLVLLISMILLHTPWLLDVCLGHVSVFLTRSSSNLKIFNTQLIHVNSFFTSYLISKLNFYALTHLYLIYSKSLALDSDVFHMQIL